MDVFSNQNFWEEYGSTPDYQERFEKISGFIPDGPFTILDVGCGDCSVIRNLSSNRPGLSLFGVDTFPREITQDKFSYCQAKLPFIPFPERTFDTVISLEVLEHLEDVQKSTNEIQRLARHQVIIGVPYLENLQSLSTICNDCKQPSHAYGHLHRFSKNDMVDLLPEFNMEYYSLVGVKQRRASRAGVFFEHRLAGAYYHAEKFACPFCGSRRSTQKKKNPVIYPIVHGLNRFLTLFSPKIPYWIMATYIRKP